MAFVLNDRVKETTTTTGTGTVNLGGAATGFETFVAGIGNSNSTYYCIAGQTTAEFEVGIGTVTDASPDTLSRTTILSSSNSDSAVDFSAGTKDVFCTLPAAKTIREFDTAVNIPTGTTAQRSSSAAAGDFRYNTSTGRFEGYSSAWNALGGSNTFSTDIFAGDGSDTTFTLSQSIENENDLFVFIDGVFQAHNSYSVSGTTLTFSTAPANSRVITAYSVKSAVSGNNVTISTMDGDGSDTTLTLAADPVNENNVQVYIDGVYQNKDTFAVSGTTLTFSAAPPNGTKVEAITLTQTNINTATQLADADGDTKVQVEETADEDKIRFDTGGTERVIIDSTGVGIGVTSPTGKLEIAATGTNAAPHIKLTESGDTREFNIYNDGSGNGRLVLADSDDDTSDTEIVLADNGNIQFKTATSERMLIDSSGNVLVGTTTFNNLSTESGVLASNNVVMARGGLADHQDACAVLQYSNDTTWLRAYGDTAGSGFIVFRVGGGAGSNDTEAMRIDSSGNLCLGTTAAHSGSILSITSKFNSSAGFTTQIFSSDSAEQFSIRGDGQMSVGTDGNSPYSNTTGSSANAVLLSNGVLARSTSSQRYKKDIADAIWGLTEVKKLRPITFKSNRTGEYASDKIYGGLIAEEVHDIGLTEFVEYNDSNEPDALHYGNMVALLTKAIQEQQELIETLQAKVEALENG